jgi:uncharacterized membrane protein
MKKQLFLLIFAVVLMFPSLRTLADSPVTFDILTTFDYPGATFSQMQGINNNGDVAGFFTVANSLLHGFVRFPNHLSGPINEPNDEGNTTKLTDINDLGTVCGYYVPQTDPHYHSFFATGLVFTEINVGAMDTFAFGVNNSGNTCGYTATPAGAFVIIDGVVTSFNVPGSTFSQAIDINSLNQTVGFYGDGRRVLGFRREADGTITYPIAAAGANYTYLSGINDNGSMVGFVYDNTGRQHAILFQSLGKQARYDYPGAGSTSFWGINNGGLISGSYVDTSLATHNFIARVRPAAAE